MNAIETAGVTADGQTVVSGRILFTLKDTHGFPLSASFEECARRGYVIDWCGIIEEARRRGWWDFQVIEEIENAFADSQAFAAQRKIIMDRIKQYVLTFRHPGMNAEVSDGLKARSLH